MSVIQKDRYAGGRRLTRGHGKAADHLAQDLRDVAADLTALKPATVTLASAGATYTAAEQALINDLKAKVNAMAAVVLKTTAP